MNGTDCPNCNKDIGIWAIMKVGWPTKLKCPHCKAKLKYEPMNWGTLIISIMIYITIYVISIEILLNNFDFSLKYKFAIMVLIAVGFWQPFEYYIVTKLRKKHILKLKD